MYGGFGVTGPSHSQARLASLIYLTAHTAMPDVHAKEIQVRGDGPGRSLSACLIYLFVALKIIYALVNLDSRLSKNGFMITTYCSVKVNYMYEATQSTCKGQLSLKTITHKSTEDSVLVMFHIVAVVNLVYFLMINFFLLYLTILLKTFFFECRSFNSSYIDTSAIKRYITCWRA